MNEPVLKKKNLLKRIIKNQLFVTVFASVMMSLIILGSSLAIVNSDTETGKTDVLVTVGDLEAIISDTSNTLTLDYTTPGVSDAVGSAAEGYSFTVKNIGSTRINYYELRIVDKEYEISSMPHKAIRYTIKKNDDDYILPANLGDTDSYIYVGGSLSPSASDVFNLKLWVSLEDGDIAKNKLLNASLELSIYSDIDASVYTLYDLNGGAGVIPKTRVSMGKITSKIPYKTGYTFLGWSGSVDGNVEYETNDNYNGKRGILYAVYEENAT